MSDFGSQASARVSPEGSFRSERKHQSRGIPPRLQLEAPVGERAQLSGAALARDDLYQAIGAVRGLYFESGQTLGYLSSDADCGSKAVDLCQMKRRPSAFSSISA